MKRPNELMSKNYCGPSKVIPLGQIQKDDGFKFTGIDKDGGKHYCIIRKDGDKYFMGSNTITFDQLIGWVPDADNKSKKKS